MNCASSLALPCWHRNMLEQNKIFPKALIDSSSVTLLTLYQSTFAVVSIVKCYDTKNFETKISFLVMSNWGQICNFKMLVKPNM